MDRKESQPGTSAASSMYTGTLQLRFNVNYMLISSPEADGDLYVYPDERSCSSCYNPGNGAQYVESLLQAIDSFVQQKVATTVGQKQNVLRELEQKKPQLDELVHTAENLRADTNRQQLHGKANVPKRYFRNTNLDTARDSCGQIGITVVPDTGVQTRMHRDHGNMVVHEIVVVDPYFGDECAIEAPQSDVRVHTVRCLSLL
ncbi:Dystrophin, isoforms A/C/F/G/H [Ooceraea biroi]|uniref:Dystrophin, isoforms A/C/F/G/H n=1 Tax=Ooceraea biroi TaxID=2015173 RepID=A0A026WI93_OOCBI|nr:Dystrophin, isoforms A/C/F/G/H [Ooceraea biroi]